MDINQIIDAKAKLEEIQKDIATKLQAVSQLKDRISKRDESMKKVADVLETEMEDFIEKNTMVQFFEKPYALIPFKNSYLVVVPKFVRGFQVGWLWKETDQYYIYQVNQYSRWLGDVPKDLWEKVGPAEEIQAEIIEDRVHFSPSERKKIERKFKGHLTEITDNSARIRKGHEFKLIADMIEVGTLPFKERKVLQKDLRKGRSKIELREYQQPAFDKFLQVGAIGLFHPTGAGKSFVSLKAIDVLSGDKLIVVPNRSLVEQWTQYVKENIPHARDEITITTYQGFKHTSKSYVLTIFDECHKLPANTFSRLALINTRYRIGLSASPHREDGREAYIFALTGFPVGLNWESYMNARGKAYHPVNVHVVNGSGQKAEKAVALVQKDKKTMIFSDNLALGQSVAKKLKLPFVYGETTNRLRAINDNQICVVSRVGDLGISVKDLNHVIEVDFLSGSRQQELQRAGRLLHSESEDTRHDIIMTQQELDLHQKRLWGLQEKGFEIKILDSDAA